jgi:hypothetical protein
MLKTRSLFLTGALLLSGAAGAQDTLLEYVTESCQADMDKYCDQVTPGEGRLLYCAAAHQDKLSDTCQGALVNAALIMNDLTDRVMVVAEACEDELMTHCADVEVGGGQVLACLDEHDDELSEGCDEALDELVD